MTERVELHLEERNGHFWCLTHDTWWKLCPCPGQVSMTADAGHDRLRSLSESPVTPDERIVQAFLVADDILRHRPPATGSYAFGVQIFADPRMPPGMAALGSPNGSIVVREMP